MTVPQKVLRYWHTVRYLRPVQIIGRARFRLTRPSIDTRPAPARAPAGSAWVAPARREASLHAPDTFRFLNESRSLAGGWDDPAVEKLWRYNLHYFDDLNARESAARATWHRRLVSRWVSENPAGTGTGWEPYPTSLRIVNWVKWALNSNELSADAAQSLAVQTRWLANRLETHLLGNHLLSNAKALFFSGMYHDGREAREWLATACRILGEQLPEQILDDGAHFELSPMYHAIALEDMLDLVNVASAYNSRATPESRAIVTGIRQRIDPMFHWLRAMSHPDGEVSFFNDAAFGIAPTLAELLAYAGRLGLRPPEAPAERLARLRASGFVRASAGDAVLIADVGPVGPDHLPGHAHADTLSFECSLFGERLFVNSGTSVYGTSPERQRQRGTAAHNTVVVDGEDSSEVWAGFRVAQRARAHGVDASAAADVRIRGSHDGYRRLPGKVLHAREWVLADGRLDVLDRLTGSFRQAEARFHLHPSVEVRPAGAAMAGAVDLRLTNGRMIRVTVTRAELRVEESTWHPGFGLSMPNRCLVARFAGPEVRTTVRWP